jgi:hypothetical protein
MANTDKIVQSIDYTSRDYYSLRNDLIRRVQTSLASGEDGKVWYGDDPADFGVAVVEAFAHVGDVTNYYIDRMANEAYLNTALQRQSILNLASTYGYQVAGYRQAELEALFVNSGPDPVALSEGTILSTIITVQSGDSTSLVEEFFTLEEDVELEEENGSVTALLSHGRNVSVFPENAADSNDPYDVAGELLGYSDGYSSQSFTLKYNQVVDGSVAVYVRNGDVFTQWTQVLNTIDYGPADAVYTVSTDANNYVTVTFGDGVAGSIPVFGDQIKATYIVGGGVNGNLESGKSFSIIKVPVDSDITTAELNATVAVTSQTKGYGGEEPEANSSIRVNAPKAFSAASRAVSLKDFKDLATTVAGVSKVTSYTSNPSSVVLYMGPEISEVSSDYYPGINVTNTEATTAWVELRDELLAEVQSKSLLGTSVTVLPPNYVPVTLAIEYVAAEGFTDAQVRGGIRYAVIYGFGYNNLDFDQTIRPEKLEQELSKVVGIEYVKVLAMYRTGDSVARTTLVAGQGEFFVFRDDTTAIYSAPSLSALVATTGTLSPVFSPDITDYTIATASSSMTFTPTAANTLTGFASEIKVNGTVVASGSASSSVSLSTGANTVTIGLTSADDTLTKTYTIVVTRT